MIKNIIRIATLALVTVVIDGIWGVAQTPPYPGPQTPTNLWVTVTHVDTGISLDITPKNLLTEPATIDVIGANGHTANSENIFGVGTVQREDYKFFHMTLDDIGSYTGTDPCTGMTADHAPIQFLSPLPILGGPVPGEVQINYMVPHPVTGLKLGYLPMLAAKVGDIPTELRLVLRASDSVICASSSPPLRQITVPPVHGPAGIAEYLDTLNPQNDKLLVAEMSVDSLDVFYRTDGDDPSGNPPVPLQSIHGGGSGLSSPAGVFADPSHGVIGVANSGNDTITYYNWNAASLTFSSQPNGALSPLIITPSGNTIQITENDSMGGTVANGDATIPAGTFASGAELATAVGTALNSIPTTPGTVFGVAYDPVAKTFMIQVLALTSGASTVTLNWNSSTAADTLGFDSSGTSGPLGLGSSDTSDNPVNNLTGLSSPCGIDYDSLTDEVVVANKGGGGSITFYDRTATGNSAPIRTIKGSATGLDEPCGVSVLTDSSDTTQGTIIVTNSRNNSITVYDRNAVLTSPDGNVPYVRQIAGSKTTLSSPTGLFVDPDNDEFGVTNRDSNTITIYPLSGPNGTLNIPPRRTIRGQASALFGPWGIYMDIMRDEIGVANSLGNLITVHNRVEDTVQLRDAPTLYISSTEQQLYPQFFYSGDLDGGGNAIDLNPTFDGYNFYWKVTNDRIRQPGDATNGLLIPPSDLTFQLTDGQGASSLPFNCPALTPFIILEYSTNCPAPPLIQSPFPPKEGDYRVASILFTQIAILRLHLTPTTVPVSAMPLLLPTVSLFSTSSLSQAIQGITWKYVDGTGADLQSPPIIYSQQVSVNLTRPFSEINECYTQITGNSDQLVFASGALNPDARSIEPVLNGGVCEIDIKDVASIVFRVTDSLEERYIYTWHVVQ
jgi:hypothetical protein